MNQIRIHKGAESLKLIEENTFDNNGKATEYVFNNLSQKAFIVTERLGDKLHKIKKYEIVKPKQEL